VQHDADPEHVTAPIDLLAAHLLGGEIAELSLQDAGARAARFVRRLGDAEVDQLHVAFERDQHVLRRDVAMHQLERTAHRVALLVCVVEPLADLHHHVADEIDRQLFARLASVLEDGAQVLAVHVFERDEVAVTDPSEIEDLRDVGVGELHRQLRLIDEHRDEVGVGGDVGEDALDRDDALEALDAERLGAEHLGHAARVDAVKQRIFAERDGLHQRGPRPPRD
jgi:hypothetical protein